MSVRGISVSQESTVPYLDKVKRERISSLYLKRGNNMTQNSVSDRQST